MALYGEWERGLALLHKGMELNPLYPGWYHLAPCCQWYPHGRYEEAYHQARQFQMPQFFGTPSYGPQPSGKWTANRKPKAP